MTASLRALGIGSLGALLAVALVGPFGLLAQTASGFGASTVVSSTALSDSRNPLLQHNIPRLSVQVGGQTLTADFESFYQSAGGLVRWGYATSEVLVEETGTLTQYYQRGVVDFHRRADLGGAYVLERRLAWDYFGGGLGNSVDLGVELGTTNNNTGELIGPWGHKVSNFSVGGVRTGFLDFFKRLGGVEAFGFPKTEARVDTNSAGTVHIPAATPGFTRQYFQAAVMEHHPQDPVQPVKLRLLGDDLRNAAYPGNAWQAFAAFNAAGPLTSGQAYVPQVIDFTPASPATAPTPTPAPTAAPAQLSGTAELVVFGTSDAGIALYDGRGWVSLNVNSSELSTNRVNAVHVDKDDRIWAGTDAGLFRLGRDGSGASFRVGNTDRGIGSDDIRALGGRKSGDWIWLAHPDKGVSRFNGTDWARFRTDNSDLPSTAVRDIHVVDENLGRVWFATANGAALLEDDTNTWLRIVQVANSGIVGNDVTAVLIDESGRFWFGTPKQGLSMSPNLSDWSQFTTAEGLGSNDVRDIIAAANGTVWVATAGGVSRFSNGSFTTTNVANSGLPSNSARAMAEDSQGRIWVATDAGAARFDGVSWTALTTANGLPSNNTTSVTIAPAMGG